MKKKAKDKPETDFSSLLVFGYGCKIFRDDQKAISIEAGESLIPWMGDSSLRIDRYDGRGHLYNLNEYEAKPGGGLAADDLERHEEELCEEERWRSLYHDDSEDVIKEEEEQKRSQEASGAQFNFNYDNDSGVVFGPEVPEQQDLQANDDSEEYVPAPGLDLPSGVTPPSTMKQFSVIERTALLIAGQGPQMEILLKTKQAGNPVFDFLSIDHEFNKFYKHLIMLVKTKQYRKHQTPPPPPPPEVSLVPQYSDFSANLAPKVPDIQYKRSENCAYSQLINKLQKFAPAPVTAPSSVTDSTSQRSSVSSKESSPIPAVSKPLVVIPEGPIVIPPNDLQTIIDKTASYVAKNGRSFEEIVFSKDKSRFGFLKSTDKHHNYYLHKLNIYLTGNYDAAVSSEPLTFKLNKKQESSSESKVVVNNPISGLDYSSDSEDQEEDKNDNSKETKVEAEQSKGFPNLAGFLPPTITCNPKLYSDPYEDEKKKDEEEIKRKEDTNKLRDKLAAKAREKMVQVAKEKSLQLERKRKAAQFLAQLAEKKTTVSSVTPMPGADQEDKSSAEEGELTTADTNDPEDVSSYRTSASVDGEAVTAVSTWPPPAPPKLVIPQLAAPTNPVVELSSDSEDEVSRKRRRRSRSRSRSRRDRSRDRYRRRRSRSRHKKSKRKRRHSSDRDSDRRRRRRNRRHSTSDSESDSDKHRRHRDHRRSDKSDSEIVSDCDMKKTSETSEQLKSKPMIEEIVKPTVNKMTEDLRAKVRAMLENK